MDDVEQEWHEPEPYDFIHCRYMAGSIKDWPKLVRQCYQLSTQTYVFWVGGINPDNILLFVKKSEAWGLGGVL